jgi:hypothetical protein
LVNAGPDKTITLPTNSIKINGSGTDPDGRIVKYSWTTQGGPNKPKLKGENAQQLSASGLKTGTYIFRLTVTDNGGLTASDEVTVNVKTSANARLAQETFEEAPKSESEIQFYPNPARNIIHVAGLKNGSEVRMMSAAGTSMYKKIVANQSVDISDIAPGLYILDCHDGVNFLRTKFIKE